MKIPNVIYQMVKISIMLIFLLIIILLSVMIGSKYISLSDIYLAIHSNCSQMHCVVVREIRIPRTLAGLLVGASLGQAGILMQSLTNNPIADPGILGINAGAGFAVLLGITIYGKDIPGEWFLFAFIGALFTAIIVSVISILGKCNINSVRLLLSGLAITAFIEGLTNGLSLINPQLYEYLRFWHNGTLDIRDTKILQSVLPAFLIGTFLSLGISKSLNTLNMGDEFATILGTRIIYIQLLSLLAIILLCSSATAVIGPISFVGLMTSCIVRTILGNDYRWLVFGSILIAPCLLISADILGRIIVPGELCVSIVSAIIGSPIMIILVRYIINNKS